MQEMRSLIFVFSSLSAFTVIEAATPVAIATTHLRKYKQQPQQQVLSTTIVGRKVFVANLTQAKKVVQQQEEHQHRLAYGTGRQALIELLDKPIFKHLNTDDGPIRVMLTLIPLKIQDLNEKSEVLGTTVRLQLTWQDKRLSWDPESFSNISEVVVNTGTIWVPDIAILNSVADVYDVIRDKRFEVKVESTGRLWWHPTGIIKTYCKLYLRYYPFDKQICWIVFESPTLDIRFMNLTLRTPDHFAVDTRMYMASETWKLQSAGGRCVLNQVGAKTAFSRVLFYMFIERAKIFHILNVILPAIFLSSVQVMLFLVPVTHPQRLGSSTTTLLSVVVFQTVAIGSLPKTSTDIPLLAIYIFSVVVVSALSVSTSIIVARFAVYAEKKVQLPRCLEKIPHPTLIWYYLRCRHRHVMPFHYDDVIDINNEPQNLRPRSYYPDPTPLHETVGARLSGQHDSFRIKHSAVSNQSSLHPPLVTVPSLRTGLIVVDQTGMCHPAAVRSTSDRCQCTTTSYCPITYQSSYPMTGCTPPQHLHRSPSSFFQRKHRSNSCQTANPPPDVIVIPPSPQNEFPEHDFRNLLLKIAEKKHLFNNWNDFSRFVDMCLMIVAASIAMTSPVILFVILPNLSMDLDPSTAPIPTLKI